MYRRHWKNLSTIMSTYNIALCFYGEARNWQVGGETIKKFHNILSIR